MSKILLIDGHSILNRAFYGLPPLTNSKGLHTNAVYGFLNIMFRVLDAEGPDHIAVAFDLHAPTFRHEKYAEYKGTRKPMPAELREQVPVIREVLSAMGISVVTKEGYEADDILGTLAKQWSASGKPAVILSGDRDLLQLVDENITLKFPKTARGTTEILDFTPEMVEEVYGYTPDQVVDMKALMGDSSDNIPGLPGVGEKTAKTIISSFGTLENAFEHVSEIRPPKAQRAMQEHYDLAVLSKELATINTQVPLEETFDSMEITNFYTPEAYALFKELEFKNYYDRFEEADKEQEALPAVRIFNDFSALSALGEEVKKQKRAGFDLQIQGEKCSGAAFAYGDELVYVAAEGFITPDYLLDTVRDILSSECEFFAFSFKEQQNLLRIPKRENVFDIEIAEYLLDPLRAGYSYEASANAWLSLTLPDEKEITSGLKKGEEPDQDMRARISGYKAFTALNVSEKVLGALAEKGMEKLYKEIEMPLVFTLSDMETAGIRLLSENLRAFSERLSAEIESEQAKIYELAGEEFNIQSPKQLGVILFEKLGLPYAKKTKSGYSTAVDVLEKLAPEAPIVQNILHYRQLTKLKSTYADALESYVKKDGRIHTNFRQTITATGRLSCTDPNLQNIPVRMEMGREIRKAFVPAEGCIFIDADYSQIELRLLAHLSGDEMLIEAYKNADDIHAITASKVFHVPLSEVTPLMRRNAKAVNFGIVYGISSFGLSQDLSISRKEASEYIKSYFETYPGIREYLDSCVADAKKNGFTMTLYGRIRPIPELSSSNFMQRSFGERAAMNSPIQGTAADIIKIAMNRVSARLTAEGLASKLILQVHDELLIEAPFDEEETVKILLKEEMEKAASLRVKLEVDVKSGSTWDEAH